MAGSGRSRRSAGTATASGRDCWVSAVSVPSGPSSTKVLTPAASNSVTTSANRTASRTWRTQYSGSVISSANAIRPVRFETTGIRGAAKVSDPSTSRNSASIPSIRAEWNA